MYKSCSFLEYFSCKDTLSCVSERNFDALVILVGAKVTLLQTFKGLSAHAVASPGPKCCTPKAL
jgi:hypothetical protein